MPLEVHADRGREVAELLYRAFSTTGIHGQKTMPEDEPPAGVARGSLDHVLFITLVVSIDYQRDAAVLWDAGRRTFADAATRYLFDPAAVHAAVPADIRRDMTKYGLSKKPSKDANIWRTVAVSFLKKWGGDPRNFLKDCGGDATVVIERLRSDTHPQRERLVPDFPYLRGKKIGPLWVRMLRDNVGIEMSRLNEIPIPVDVHIARATLATGVVRGSYAGSVEEAFVFIRQAWFESVCGLRVEGRDMQALDVDEPLWHLSRFGCTHRDKISGECPHIDACPVGKFCIRGRLHVDGSKLNVET